MYPASPEILELEIDLILEAIFHAYKSDFRHYARASVHRRLLRALVQLNVPTISELQAQILHNPPLYHRLLHILTVPTTEMFRDPLVFANIRQHVLPHLRTYPSIKAWVAGCSTGEEAYALAILLQEQGLLDRTQIYATDINPFSLKVAEAGVYPLESMEKYCESYQCAGGTGTLEEYYQSGYGHAKFCRALRDHMVFADHSLATDSAFGEMEFILCRNVLIYFDSWLQDRALQMFYEALGHRGFLCLGARETVLFSRVALHFEELSAQHKIYRKKSDGPFAHLGIVI